MEKPHARHILRPFSPSKTVSIPFFPPTRTDSGLIKSSGHAEKIPRERVALCKANVP